ncbi:MAG: TetR/AcrR family transcriptional regulator [Myxococcota bacterium]
MSAPLRRTQAERTAETRRRILDAVVASIAEVGFQRTTATEIAKRAGVTWGAVQHHFGAKGGILEAVLEDTFERFEERLGDIPGDAPLARRVALFVERAWEHFSGPHFRSTFEILLHHGKGEGADLPPHWQDKMFRDFDRVFERLFADCGLPRRERAALHQYTVGQLMGLAAMNMLDEPRSRRPQLAILERTLLLELGG